MKKHLFLWLVAGTLRIAAQQPAPAKPPAPHACQTVQVTSNGAPAKVHVAKVSGTPYPADFSFNVNLFCNQNSSGPAGTLTGSIAGASQGAVASTGVTELVATGSVTPTVYASGSCQIAALPGAPAGSVPSSCHYWVAFTQLRTALPCPFTNTAAGAIVGCESTTAAPINSQPDAVIAFQIADNSGNLIIYGAGPVTNGTVTVTAPGMNN